ncbi:MAG: hypothetical protein JXR07_20235 [Reichenbachiella sp.]
MKKYSTLLKVSSVLWIIWGLFHVFVGVFLLYLLINNQVAEALNGIAGTVPLENLQMEYPYAAIATIKQHAFNLGWFGLVTIVAGIYIWKKNPTAIWLAALVGGLGDLGYFIFIDLADLAISPGPQMTWISGSAIIFSFYVYYKTDRLSDLP